MLTAAQVSKRRTLLGASDFPVLCGVSPYKRTVHDLWVEKCLHPDEEPDQTEAQSLGHELEGVVVRLLARHLKVKIKPGTETRRHPKLPFVGATPDGIIGSRRAPLELAEVKAPGMHFARHWGESGDPEGLPEYLIPQVEIQATVWNVPRVHVSALIGNEPRFYVYEHNAKLSHALLELARDWWTKHVIGRTPPDVDGSESSGRMLAALFPRGTRGTLLRADDELEARAKAYFEAEREEKAAAERRQLAENEIKARIGEFDGIAGDGWEARWRTEAGRVSWKAVAEAARVKEKVIEAHRGAPIRKFSCKAT